MNSLPTSLRTANSGFTLIELMVTIAVLAIIVSIAAPNISTQLANQRVKSTAAIIESALKEAKAESIIRRQNVTVAYNNTANTITLQASGANISSYDISASSTVSITPTTVTAVIFQPNKLIAGDDDISYSICDSGSSNETLGQVRVNKIANIDTTNTGSC